MRMYEKTVMLLEIIQTWNANDSRPPSSVEAASHSRVQGGVVSVASVHNGRLLFVMSRFAFHRQTI